MFYNAIKYYKMLVNARKCYKNIFQGSLEAILAVFGGLIRPFQPIGSCEAAPPCGPPVFSKI